MSRNEALHFINAAHFLDHFFLLIFPTAALAIAPAWDKSYGEVLLLGSPIYFMFALGTLPAGWLGDRIDHMALIAVFFLGCGGSCLSVGVSQGPLAMTVGLGALGLFAAIYHPVGGAHITQIGFRTGRALAVNGVFGNMGLAAAAVVTGVLAETLGWRAAFLVPGSLSVLLGLLLIWRNRYQKRTARECKDADFPASVPQDRSTQVRIFAVICVSALFGGLIFNAVTVSLPKFLDERLIGAGGNLAWIGAYTGSVFAVAAFAQLPVGELLDRIGARPILTALLCLQALSLMLLARATGGAALVLIMALVTFIFAEIPVTSWLVGHYLAPSIRSRIMAVEYVLSLGIGSAAVPLIALLQGKGFGFGWLYPGLAVAAVMVLVAASFLPKHRALLKRHANTATDRRN
ncbi:MFS transporter [Rhodobacterales bacterium]|nr:MFS transporter [Rhodobacterales bacterium]